jgi:hypothetical protein
MKPLNAKKLAASAIIFLFSNFSASAMADAPEITATPQVTQEVLVATQAPTVAFDAPYIANISQTGTGQALFLPGDKVALQSVHISSHLFDMLKGCTSSFNPNNVAVSGKDYGNQPAGYVLIASTHDTSGLMQIQKPQNELEKILQELLANPEKFHVRADLVSPAICPKILAEQSTHSHLLLMQPWDMRTLAVPYYDQRSLEHMFTNVYAAFKGYAQQIAKVAPKLNQQTSVVIHSSYWGADYKNNLRVTSALQLLAADLAGVDKFIFHVNLATQDAQAHFDAQTFVQAQSGNSIDNIMQALLKQTAQSGWQV